MTGFGSAYMPPMTAEQRAQQRRLAERSGYGKDLTAIYAEDIAAMLRPLSDWELRELLQHKIQARNADDESKAELMTEVIHFFARSELRSRPTDKEHGDGRG